MRIPAYAGEVVSRAGMKPVSISPGAELHVFNKDNLMHCRKI